ncbi:response regulator transcription factor, partial [Pseudomonas sp. FSL R10-2189]|uniref:response regulator transcription factor n=1 Tax=Pseudomonas sp. FSL R10-2189 TaxID=2662199 RepID=UPI002114443A
LTFSKILDSFSSRSDFFYTLKCEEPNYFPSQALTPENIEGHNSSELELFKLVNDRELMVLKLFAQGKTNKEIATGMFLSNKTVSTYKKRLMQKLKANSLVDLIELAKRNALV